MPGPVDEALRDLLLIESSHHGLEPVGHERSVMTGPPRPALSPARRTSYTVLPTDRAGRPLARLGKQPGSEVLGDGWRSHAEAGDEVADAPADLISDGPDLVEGLTSGVVQFPVLVAFAG